MTREQHALALLAEIVEYIGEHSEWAQNCFFEGEDSWEDNWYARASAIVWPEGVS